MQLSVLVRDFNILTMVECLRNTFVLFLLMWIVDGLDKEYDWTFGRPELNIAYNKSSTDPKVVDDDFMTTREDLLRLERQWWKVDLGAIYTVAMIRMYPKTPKNIHLYIAIFDVTIWISKAPTPPHPRRGSDEWEKGNSHVIVYGYGVTADFQPPDRIRHVCVTTLETQLKIAELQIFAPMNLAQLASITSSESFNLLSLVDGNYGEEVQMRAAGKKWIDFDLLEVYSIRIIEIFKCNDQEAKILTAKGNPAATLSQSEDGWTPNAHTSLGPAGEMKFEFSTPILEVQRVALVSYKSSSSLTVAEVVVHASLFYSKQVNAIKSEGDELCFTVENSLGDSFIIECSTTFFHGLRIVSLASTTDLREIVVYGKELPTMGDSGFDAKRVDSTTVILTFNQWNSKSSGFKAPDKYILRNEGSGTLDRTEFVHDGSGPIQTNITGSQRNDLISVYAECEIDGEKCAGRPAEVYYFSLYEGQTQPTKPAPTTEKAQNTTGIIVGVTLATVFLVLVGIGAAIFVRKKRTTAGEEVANKNKSNKVFPTTRERMAEVTKPREEVPVSKLPNIRVAIHHA